MYPFTIPGMRISPKKGIIAFRVAARRLYERPPVGRNEKLRMTKAYFFRSAVLLIPTQKALFGTKNFKPRTENGLNPRKVLEIQKNDRIGSNEIVPRSSMIKK